MSHGARELCIALFSNAGMILDINIPCQAQSRRKCKPCRKAFESSKSESAEEEITENRSSEKSRGLVCR